MNRTLACLSLTLLLAAGPSGRAHAEIYTWQDSEGTTHFTDDLGQVPEAQRRQYQDAPEPTPAKNAPARETSAPTSKSNDRSSSAPAAPAASPAPAKGPEQNETYWKNRIQESQTNLDSAQKELDQVHQDQRKNLESGPGMQERQASLASREAELKERIAKLQQDLDTNIPNEAQKAGAPPGWLR